MSFSTVPSLVNFPRRKIIRRRRVVGKKLNKRQRREVKTMVLRNQELKHLTHDSTGFNDVTTTGTITGAIADIANNVGGSARVGDSIMWAGSMKFRIQFTGSLGAGSEEYNTVRLIIFQWHPVSTPNIASILSQGPVSSFDVYSNYNFDNRQQYKILLDKTYNLINVNGLTAVATAFPDTYARQFNFTISLKRARKMVQYSPTGGLTGTNRIYLILLSDSSVGPHPKAAYASQVFYRDA